MATPERREPKLATWPADPLQHAAVQDLPWGRQVLSGPWVAADGIRARLELLPTSQGNGAREQLSHSTLWVCLSGSLDVNVGDEWLLLTELDMLMTVAGTAVQYGNFALSEARIARIERMSPPRADKSLEAGYHLYRWQDYRHSFHWDLPLATREGLRRGSGPFTKGVPGHAVRVPPGQRSPWHSVPCDGLFATHTPGVTFSAGGRTWTPSAQDVLFVPRGIPYAYENDTDRECLFFTMISRFDPEMPYRYYVEDPGWPVRPDAVEVDPNG